LKTFRNYEKYITANTLQASKNGHLSIIINLSFSSCDNDEEQNLDINVRGQVTI
jgi:hypothetical protein